MRKPVHIWIREENADARELAGYFVEIARRLDENPVKMRLVVESTVPASLDIDPKDGCMVALAGDGKKRFQIRGRWIPEHPVPLDFGPDARGKRRRTVLLIDPAENNRFHVRSSRNIAFRTELFGLLALLAVVAVATLHPAAIMSVAVLLALIAVTSCRK